jgi:ATP-dependent RNA helicase RhlE
MTFEELNLAPAILKAVLEQGYETPTPVQAQAIPVVLEGKDLLAGAQTGTGKTAAFTLPMLHRLTMSRSATNKFGSYGIRALVLTPTRELAAQVEESVRTYGKYLQLQSAVIFGGVGMAPQIAQLKRGVDILVATPGRLLDLQQQGFLDLSTVQMLVLDEADRMLDMGFIHDVRKVLALVPRDKQSLLFSATFSDEIRELANTLLHEPQSIQVTPRNTTVQRINQVIHPVGRGKKKELLAHIIQAHNWSQVLVFTRTKFGANHVAEYLEKHGVTAMALHGNKSQTARTQALAGFKSGDIRALVATDIAARGIDIEDLPHVVNYEIPNVPEDYVHRIGRTGRAGASGEAVSLVCMDEEGFMQEIERFTRQDIEIVRVEGFGPDEGERAEPIAMGRQTLWGGAGKPPSREVMASAAKAARSEMLQRIRENKPQNGAAGGRGGQQQPRRAAPAANNGGGGGRMGYAVREQRPNLEDQPYAGAHEGTAGARPGRGNGGGGGSGRGGFGGDNGRGGPRRSQGGPGMGGQPNPLQTTATSRGPNPNRAAPMARPGGQPNPLQTNTIRDLTSNAPKLHHGDPRQPDPTRTSIDIMSERSGGRGRGGRPSFGGGAPRAAGPGAGVGGPPGAGQARRGRGGNGPRRSGNRPGSFE